MNAKFIRRVTTIPLGVQWGKEDKAINVTAKKNFFLHKEKSVEDKNGVIRESPLTLGMKWPITSSSTDIVRGG